ncbi:MAG: transposase [Thermoplasmata archaeon]
MRTRLESPALDLILASLASQAPKFPRRTLLAAIRNLLKAGATTGTLTSGRSTSSLGPSRRQLSRVTETLDQTRLQRKITWTLRAQVRPWLPQNPVDIAIDFHLVPYAGERPKTSQLLASKAKQGTNRFHGYSTVAIVQGDQRLTVGLRAVREPGHLLSVVQRHLEDAHQLGLKVRWVLLDREFYCGDVIEFLRAEGLHAVMPVRAGPKMRAEWEKGRRSFTTLHTMKSKGREVRFRVQVVKLYKKGRRGEHGVESLFYVVIGPRLPPTKLRALYRGRFGIEATYRVAESARARTTSRRPVYRLLLMALAILVENEWVILQLTHATERCRGRKGYRLREELLRFERLLTLLLAGLRSVVGEILEVGTTGPPPKFVELMLKVGR